MPLAVFVGGITFYTLNTAHFLMLPLFVYKNYNLPVEIVRRKGMKNIILRLSKTKDRVIISANPRKSLSSIREFYDLSRSWIEKQLDKTTVTQPEIQKIFYPQMSLNIAEKAYHIAHQESRRRRFDHQDDKLVIHGPLEAFPTLLKAYLRDHLKEKCENWSDYFAKRLQVKVNRVTIKDVQTRWGSCSIQGNLNYNWRLVFAPDIILEYVCAHEVAHLVHMNHSTAFWAVVETLYPDHREARQWLKQHGSSLYAYG